MVSHLLVYVLPNWLRTDFWWHRYQQLLRHFAWTAIISTCVPPAILLMCSGFKKKKEKKKAPFTLPHSTDTDESRTHDLNSDWLNTRKGKWWADKASSKGISLRLSQFSSASTNPDLQSILNFLLSLSNVIRELSIKEQISTRAGYQPEETIQLIAGCA